MKPDRRRPTRILASSIASRTLVVAAVVGITMLGNLRLQASEVPQVAASRPASPALAGRVVPSASRVPVRIDVSTRNAADLTTDDDRSAAQDDVQLVPAIYAWDPDVRFVYFRHVSKWM